MTKFLNLHQVKTSLLWTASHPPAVEAAASSCYRIAFGRDILQQIGMGRVEWNGSERRVFAVQTGAPVS